MTQSKPQSYYYFMDSHVDSEALILFNIEEKLYDKALELLNKIQHDLSPRLVVAKAKCLLGLDRNVEALDLLVNAEKFGWDLPQIITLKGFALFKLKEYHTAKMAFERCLEIKPSQEIKRWIQRCIVHLSANNEEISRRVIRYEPQLTHCPSPQLNPQLQQQFQQLFQLPPQQPQEQCKSQQQNTNNIEDEQQINEKLQQEQPQQLQKRPQYEWYQSQTHATMVLYIKDVDKSQIDLKFSNDFFDMTINAPQKILMHVHLSKNIDPTQSSFSVTPKKIEIKMKKQEEGQWSSFEEHP